MRGYRMLRRLVHLTVVLATLIVGTAVEPLIMIIPNQYAAVRFPLRLIVLIGTPVALGIWIIGKPGEDNLPAQPTPTVEGHAMHPKYGYMVSDTDQGLAITCFRCGMTSYNPHDIEHLFCGRCKTYYGTPVDNPLN